MTEMGEPHSKAEISKERLPVSRRESTNSPRILRARKISAGTMRGTAGLGEDIKESRLLKK